MPSERAPVPHHHKPMPLSSRSPLWMEGLVGGAPDEGTWSASLRPQDSASGSIGGSHFHPPAARQEETSSRGAWPPDEAAVPVCESLRGARRARLGDLCRSCVTMRQQGFRVFQVSVC